MSAQPLPVLFVVPRYGRDIVGGAETLVRALVTRGLDATRFTPTVATTCAVDHTTWENALAPGESVEDGVRVLRFPVAPRDGERYAYLQQRLHTAGRLSYLNQLELLAASVWSGDLQRFLEREGPNFHRIVFAPYLFGTTFWGAQAHPERTLLLPCLHDEPEAHMDCLREPFGAVRGWIFNAPAEERLVRRLFAVRDGAVVGCGLDLPTQPPPEGFARRHGLGRYLIYVGRLEEGKRVQVAVEYTARLVREQRLDLKLVLVGTGSYQVPHEHRDVVVELGFLDEAEKRAALAGAVALVNPSELESLSLVLLEAWREGTPALVAAGSEVMREHCAASGGGRTFSDFADFSAEVSALIGDHGMRAAMGAAGRGYVEREYGWSTVTGRLSEALSRSEGPGRLTPPVRIAARGANGCGTSASRPESEG